MEKVRVGVVGIGKMGRYHIRAYSSLKHMCDLVGLYDIEKERSQMAAREYGTLAFPSYEELLDAVDAITIATPTSTHARVALQAIMKNTHILIEKPITGEIQEARTLLQAARKKGLILQVGHIERFNPAIHELPRVLKGKKIFAINSERLSPYDPRVDDADVIQDLMIHDLDIVRSLGDSPICDLQASGRIVNGTGLIDYAVTLITFENDIVATLTASRITEKKVRRLNISASNSFVELDYLHRKLTVSHRKSQKRGELPPYDEDWSIEKVFIPQEDALTAQLKHYLTCIQQGTNPLIDGNDGLEALRLTKEIQNRIYTFCHENRSSIR